MRAQLSITVQIRTQIKGRRRTAAVIEESGVDELEVKGDVLLGEEVNG
jgi:hypothetical protein